MKISIKLLKGDLLEVDLEDGAATVVSLKEKIEFQRPDLTASRQKLIHAGKVLKDETKISDIGINVGDFIVCMVTKEIAKPKPNQSPTPGIPPVSSSPAVTSFETTNSQPTATLHSPNFVTANALAALTSMGFPEAECRAALTASMGNPDIAYEFLLTGIPAYANPLQASVSATSTAQAAVGNGGIQQLRSHPQFNMLKQLIQSNPASLPQVLTLIGQQNPSLLQIIHENEGDFLTMMNEPAQPVIPVTPTATNPVLQQFPMPTAGQPNSAQILQLVSAMPPAQRSQFLQSIGLNTQQIEMFTQMMQQLTPEQMAQMASSMSGSDGGGQGYDGQPTGAIALTHEEMESINRLMALGFTQQQAAQAFIACDRNETLAANFLFENGGFEDDFDDDEQ